MSFIYDRTIHFQDTDAAGVVYFVNVLAMCHEAYEASLMASEMDLKVFFSASTIAFPIIHASVDFFSPLYCGDRIQIQVTPQQLTESKFEIYYRISLGNNVEKLVSKALTQHVCIEPNSRNKLTLPAGIIQWLMQWGKEESTGSVVNN